MHGGQCRRRSRGPNRATNGTRNSAGSAPDRDDEVNRPEAGRNYGWDPVPGYNEAVPMTDLGKFRDRRPRRVELGHPDHRPLGRHLPRGRPVGTFSWRGAKLLSQDTAITNRGRLRSPVQGPDGNLYIATDLGAPGGSILRVVPS